MIDKDKFGDYAFQQLDACIEKHTNKIKNCIYGIIFHAYNMGLRDGKNAQKKEQIKNSIKIGDEVCTVNSDGSLNLNDCFIVTEYDANEYMGGITLNGDTHFHSGEEMDCWRRTGRHYDVIKMLDQIEATLNEMEVTEE